MIGMSGDLSVLVLVRTDITARIAHVVGVFSEESEAISAMSFDVFDFSRRFADAFLNSSDPLNVVLSDGDHSMFMWSVVSRGLDEPVYMPRQTDFGEDPCPPPPDNVF